MPFPTYDPLAAAPIIAQSWTKAEVDALDFGFDIPEGAKIERVIGNDNYSDSDTSIIIEE